MKRELRNNNIVDDFINAIFGGYINDPLLRVKRYSTKKEMMVFINSPEVKDATNLLKTKGFDALDNYQYKLVVARDYLFNKLKLS